MPVSEEEIKEIAQLFFHESPKERANQCARLTSIMQSELEDNPNIGDQPVLQKGVIEYNGETVGHAFLTLPASEIKEAKDGPVIIDATIQQFCKENYQNGDVKLEVESYISLPEDVGIFTPQDKAFDLYNF